MTSHLPARKTSARVRSSTETIITTALTCVGGSNFVDAAEMDCDEGARQRGRYCVRRDGDRSDGTPTFTAEPSRQAQERVPSASRSASETRDRVRAASGASGDAVSDDTTDGDDGETDEPDCDRAAPADSEDGPPWRRADLRRGLDASSSRPHSSYLRSRLVAAAARAGRRGGMFLFVLI